MSVYEFRVASRPEDDHCFVEIWRGQHLVGELSRGVKGDILTLMPFSEIELQQHIQKDFVRMVSRAAEILHE